MSSTPHRRTRDLVSLMTRFPIYACCILYAYWPYASDPLGGSVHGRGKQRPTVARDCRGARAAFDARVELGGCTRTGGSRPPRPRAFGGGHRCAGGGRGTVDTGVSRSSRGGPSDFAACSLRRAITELARRSRRHPD